MSAIIDVHHHLLPDFYIEAIGTEALTRQAPRFSAGALDWTPQASLDTMDAHGVAAALLSISAPGVWCGSQSKTTRLVRKCNEYTASLVVRHPQRFGMFAALPLPDVDAALEEIEFVHSQTGTDGFGLMSCYGDAHLGDAKFAPVFDELNRRGAVVFIHPTITDACKAMLPGYPASILEFPVDTTRAAFSLLYSGTLARCKNIRFVFSHAGGAVPFLAHRLTRLDFVEEFAERTGGAGLELLRNQFYDVALSANKPALSALTAFAKPENVLFGSDYPFAPNMTARTREGLAAFDPHGDILKGVERDNALALFPRFAATE